MSKRAVFLDRDGTLIEDVGFVRRVEDVKLLPQAAQAVATLNEAGWAVVVVTNQSGVARGLLTESDVAATNTRMMDLLKRQHARVDAIYYCPHLPEGKVPEYAVVCECRKPRPGMILHAANDLDIDLAQSVTIGDAPRDVEAGLAAGTRAILLTESATRAARLPDACGQAVDLRTAVEEVLTLHAPAPAAAAPAPAAPPEPPSAAEEVREIPIQAAPKEFTPEPEAPAPREKRARKRAEPQAEEPPAAAEAPAPAVAEEAVAPEAAPKASACGRCGREVDAADVEAGRAFGRDGVYLCAVCAAAVALRAEPRGEASRRKVAEKEPSLVGDLLREVQNIARTLTYRHFSPWHVLGSVAQALAIGGIVIGYATGARQEGLLFAIFLQLLALTLFVLGRM